MSGFNKRGGKKQILEYFCLLFFPLIIVLLLSLSIINILDINNGKELLKLREQQGGEILKLNIENNFSTISQDFKVIMNSNELNNYINLPDDNNLYEVNQLFKRFETNKKVYDQIRILSPNGMEKARANYNFSDIKIVDKNNLQDKSSSNYFKDMANLNKNQIYISQFDLNTEKGIIENPIKPIIRFGIPLFNNNGQKSGFLVFNYLGEDVLNQIDKYEKLNKNYKIELVNKQGYWIKNENREKEWAFMYPDKNQISFKNEKEKIWDIISGEHSSFAEDSNMYYFTSITLLPDNDSDFVNIIGYNNLYLLISCPLDDLGFFANIKNSGLLDIGIISAILIMMISLFAASILNNRKEAKDKMEMASTIMENAKEAILLTDSETRVIYVNKSFLNITGYTMKEVLGKKTSYFKSGKHSSEFYKTMWESISKHGRWQGEIWDKRKDGRLYPKNISIIKISRENDQVEYLGIFEDLTYIKEQEEKIKNLLDYDEFTMLPTLHLIKQLISNRINSINKAKEKISVISLDINNYDELKDSLGYKKMDSLILETVAVIKENCNENIVLSRTGKNEFLIFMVSSENKDAAEFIDNIIRELQKPININEDFIYLYLSIGVSIYPDDAENIEELIKNADLAKHYLYTGHSVRYHFFDKNLIDKYLYNNKIESKLRGAIERNEIYLNYQPQIDLEKQTIIGAESLIRWYNKELGNVPPDKFIPIAEKTGLILNIGEWVLDESLKQCSNWKESNMDLTVAVNFSPVQFKKMSVSQLIEKKLNKYSLDGSFLEIEITEGLLMDDNQEVREELEKIEALGVKIAIDDFGTGYSSLSYLRKFKFDKIKIDREFVKDFPEKEDGTLAQIIINLSHSLKMKVIAEGVETKAQFEFMKDNNCDEIQGYYYSPPVSAEELEELVKIKPW
ncbi:MAG: EAL domain-containing protein [Clostridiaceae bacterium]